MYRKNLGAIPQKLWWSMAALGCLCLVFMVCLVKVGFLLFSPAAETPARKDNSISGGEPVLSQNSEKNGAITVPDWIVKDILPVNEYSRPGTKLERVNGVVVHYTGNPGTTAEQNRSYYGQLALTHENKISSHFIIGMNGTVIQCVPLDEVAYCSNNRNDDTISIECCHAGKDGKFSKDTMDSLIRLLDWLACTYGLKPEQIIRHYDITGKECPRYYVTHEDEWKHLLDSIAISP